MFVPNKPDEDWYWPVEILYTLEFFDSMKEIFSVNSEREWQKKMLL